MEKTGMAENKILVVDIETTGFQNKGGLIVEIGIVSLDLKNGKVTPEFETIVQENGFDEDHTRYPYGWIFDNSDLKYEDVLKAPNLRNVVPDIQALFDRFPAGATAYNKQFDFGFLKARGLKIKELPCIMLAATPIVNLPNARRHPAPKWPSFEEAWAYFFPAVPYTELHRGLDDAQHEALVCYEIHKLGKFMPEKEGLKTVETNKTKQNLTDVGIDLAMEVGFEMAMKDALAKLRMDRINPFEDIVERGISKGVESYLKSINWKPEK